jgi:hypothetical protein
VIDYDIGSTPLSVFVAACYLFAVASSVCIVYAFRYSRFLFVKPSMQLLAFNVVFFHWPIAVFSGYLESWLPDPFSMLVLVYSFFGAGFLVSILTFRGPAMRVWGVVTSGAFLPRDTIERRALIVLCLGSVVLMVEYFRVVPVSQTGLYTAIFLPEMATQAREESLKLLDSQLIKYGFSLFASSIGPLIAVLVALRLRFRAPGISWGWLLLAILVFPLLLVFLSITGARSFAVSMLLSVALAAWLRRGLPAHPARIVLVGVAIVAPAVLLTLLREGRAIGFGQVVHYFALLIAERIFIAPVEVGATYVHFAQLEGFIGISGIPKVAQIFVGQDGIDVPNLIGLMYFGGTAASVSANAGFLFSYYSYFGSAGILLSIICALLLDMVVPLYERMAPILVLPCVAVLATATLALVSVDYTVIFITHGFLITPAICWLLGSRVIRKLHPAAQSIA